MPTFSLIRLILSRGAPIRHALVPAILLGTLPGAAGATPTFYGPTPYLCFDAATTTATGSCGASDSPFAGETFTYFHLEDFEDGALNTPGVAVSSSSTIGFASPGLNTDSVDEDDGAIDGSGQGGGSIFANAGSLGLTFTFDEVALGSLPTHVGIVWTDGAEFAGQNIVTLEAFDGNGVSLGTQVGAGLGDSSFQGGTAEDRFFGVTNADGIGSIYIYGNFGNRAMEVDHLQYGFVPEPSLGLSLALGLGLVAWRRRRA